MSPNVAHATIKCNPPALLLPGPALKPNPPTPTAGFQRTRKDHALETAEDYAEAIADIEAAQGACRVADLALRFGVSHVTVSRTVGRLVRDGFAQTERHAPVVLTPKGRRLAALAHRRHEVVLQFLLALGVSPATAFADAEGIEHHVSEDTLACFEAFLKKSASGG